MRKLLVVVDMQNDFIDGVLGTKQAEEIVDNVAAKIKEYKPEDIFVTLDTHQEDYLDTREGQFLPVKHCVEGTEGWRLSPEIESLIEGAHIVEKPTFGSFELIDAIGEIYEEEDGDIEIELVGLYTDICVISNALLVKNWFYETPIKVTANCCAGITQEKHEAALATMRSCQIVVE